MDENDLNELKYIFSYLVDSFSYEVERDKKAREIENTAKELENEKKSIESLKNGISDNINTFINVYNNFKPHGEKIMESVGSITDQFFTKNSQDTLSKISELKSEMEKYVENGTQAMENFLYLNPFTILNSYIEASLDREKIEIKQFIQCSYGISYTFMLDPNNSEFMKNPFFSSLYSGIKIPLEIDNAHNIVYENMDSYILASTRLEANNLKCVFDKPESENSFEFTYGIGTPNMDILALGRDSKNRVLDNPDLKSHLDMEILKDALEKLSREITGLAEKEKKLVSLQIDGEEILNTMDFEKIFYRIIGSDYIKSLVKSLPESEEKPGCISKELIRHRIHIIGKDEDYIMSTLFG